MKVILVNGSPHEHGCTRAALDEVAKELAGQARADLDHLHIRAGEFVAEDVEKAMGEESVVETACREIVYPSLLSTSGRRSRGGRGRRSGFMCRRGAWRSFWPER